MPIDTFAGGYVRAYTTNATDAAFPSRVPTLTPPDASAGTGVVSIYSGGNSARPGVMVVPFGAGSDDNAFDLRVIGWRVAGTGSAALWIPTTLIEVTCTLGTAIGVSGGTLVATDRLADTIVIKSGTTFADGDGISHEIVSPADNTAAHIIVDCKGCGVVEFVVAKGIATNANVLYATV